MKEKRAVTSTVQSTTIVKNLSAYIQPQGPIGALFYFGILFQTCGRDFEILELKASLREDKFRNFEVSSEARKPNFKIIIGQQRSSSLPTAIRPEENYNRSNPFSYCFASAYDCVICLLRLHRFFLVRPSIVHLNYRS